MKLEKEVLQPLCKTLLMIRPVKFDLNEQTMESNAFQQQERTQSPAVIQKQALDEFDEFVKLLRANGVEVLVFQDTPNPVTPDSIFPNNWISFHQNAKVVIYPMASPNRRDERRLDIIYSVRDQFGFQLDEIIDFAEESEANDQFLEGTGSLILDRKGQMYACISNRTHPDLVDKWCTYTNYKKLLFSAVDQNNQPIYHTNVLMCIGAGFAVICLDSISDQQERKTVIETLQNSGREIVDISFDQMNQFAGNMLQISNQLNERILVMSQQAFDSLNELQIQTLKKYNDKILSAKLNTIERYGGGSARCMMAEVFLPKK